MSISKSDRLVLNLNFNLIYIVIGDSFLIVFWFICLAIFFYLFFRN